MATASSEGVDPGADEVSLDSVMAFLKRTDGKARHADLVHHFRKPLTDNDARKKAKARSEFRDILQRVTAIKTENGEKYVLLTKARPPPVPRKTVRTRQGLDQSSQIFTNLNKLLGSQGKRNSATFGGEDDVAHEDGRTSPTSTHRSSVTETYSDSGVGSETQSVSSFGRSSKSTSKSSQSLDSDGNSDQDLDDLGLDYPNEFTAEDKQWMTSAAFGHVDQLKQILEKNPEMLSKRDTITGFAAIHWGAKLGRREIVQLMIENGVDKDLRTRGGHTALHLAAMYGHDRILIILIDKYHANKEIRDYSGKKAKDLVKQTVAPDIQRKLGRSLILDNTLHVDNGIITRSDSFSNFIFAHSPRGTPEVPRKKERSKSFLKLKKKTFGDSRSASEDSLSRDDKPKKNRRPKSVIISAPSALDPVDRSRCMTQPARSFEI